MVAEVDEEDERRSRPDVDRCRGEEGREGKSHHTRSQVGRLVEARSLGLEGVEQRAKRWEQEMK